MEFNVPKYKMKSDFWKVYEWQYIKFHMYDHCSCYIGKLWNSFLMVT